MEQKKSMKHDWIIRGWLCVSAALLLFLSWNRRYLPGKNASQGMGLVIFLILIVLYILVIWTGAIRWISRKPVEQLDQLTLQKENRFAVKQFIFLLAAFAIFCMYCYFPVSFIFHTEINDAIVAASMLCLAVLPVCKAG